MGFNAEYLRCKGVCLDSQTDRLDASLSDSSHANRNNCFLLGNKTNFAQLSLFLVLIDGSPVYM